MDHEKEKELIELFRKMSSEDKDRFLSDMRDADKKAALEQLSTSYSAQENFEAVHFKAENNF
ncbi:MAG: hypothetical protein LBK66_08095 [Spirochaetaceae bacterium]|nr:hypothetical protein [Spirochaetaceae bacterium]